MGVCTSTCQNEAQSLDQMRNIEESGMERIQFRDLRLEIDKLKQIIEGQDNYISQQREQLSQINTQLDQQSMQMEQMKEQSMEQQRELQQYQSQKRDSIMSVPDQEAKPSNTADVKWSVEIQTVRSVTSENAVGNEDTPNGDTLAAGEEETPDGDSKAAEVEETPDGNDQEAGEKETPDGDVQKAVHKSAVVLSIQAVTV